MLDGKATGIVVDTNHYADRTPSAETKRLSAASSAVFRHHLRHIGADSAVLLSLAEDTSPTPPTPPPATENSKQRPKKMVTKGTLQPGSRSGSKDDGPRPGPDTDKSLNKAGQKSLILMIKHKKPLSKMLCEHHSPRGMDATSGVFKDRFGDIPHNVGEIGMGFRGHGVDMNNGNFPTHAEQKNIICGNCGDPGHMVFFCPLPHKMESRGASRT
jgi:hypothetical protein